MKNALLFELFNIYCISFINEDDEVELYVRKR